MDCAKLLTKFEVRLATLGEKEEILADAALSHLPNITTTPHIIIYNSFRMLFEFNLKAGGIYEVHVACPKDSRQASRILALAMCAWLFKVGVSGITGLITSCPEGKIANMIRKIGGTEVKREGSTVYFMATVDSFNLK
jgi:hypothetical protein